MMKHTRQLPVRLPPYPDELLSSWINRHATFYAVPPLVMLRHCLPEASAVRAADLHLCNDQEIRLANIFATEPAVVHRMTLTNVAQSSRRLISTRPTQVCPNCSPAHAEPALILRSQLLGWRITCPLCGNQLRDAGGRELPSPFQRYRVAALRGQNLLNDEAERGIRTWASPSEIARLQVQRSVFGCQPTASVPEAADQVSRLTGQCACQPAPRAPPSAVKNEL